MGTKSTLLNMVQKKFILFLRFLRSLLADTYIGNKCINIDAKSRFIETDN